MSNEFALYDIPRRSYIKIKDDIGNYEYLFFDHIDGAYSYCKDKYGNVVHITAWAIVELVDKPEDWDKE